MNLLYNRTTKMEAKIPKIDEAFRAFLVSHIKSTFGSLGNFCLQSSYDKADLSRFLTGSKAWNYVKVFQLLQDLELKVVIRSHRKRTSFDFRKAAQ